VFARTVIQQHLPEPDRHTHSFTNAVSIEIPKLPRLVSPTTTGVNAPSPEPMELVLINLSTLT
jgi:hypothetical protein